MKAATTILRSFLAYFFGTKETFRAPGPLVPDPEHPPCVTIQRGHESAVVSWDPGRTYGTLGRALRTRLQAARMLGVLDGWIETFNAKLDPRMEREGTLLYGRVLHVPCDDADPLAALILGYFERVTSTPLTLAEYARFANKGSVAPPKISQSLDHPEAPFAVPIVEAPGFIIPWVYFGRAEHEPFTVIAWTGETRERVSESLDSPEYKGIAPDGERLWFSPSESLLLESEGRQGRELHRWLTMEHGKLVASLACC